VTLTVQTATTTTSHLPDPPLTGFVLGVSPTIHTLNAIVEQLARTSIPVLLMGESGTGKEVYARMIHTFSGGEARGLKKIACATIEAVQLSRELGELREEAEREKTQTLFLDEIEELSQECQKLLLALVPNGEFLSNQGTLRARVISATTRDMNQEVAEGRFRRELYFRLNGASLRLPPLRDRLEDIPGLMECFLNRHSEELKKSAPVLDQETIDRLKSYPWPGNIRELENVARNMVALGDSSVAVSDLGTARVIAVSGISAHRVSPLKMAVRAVSRQTERELILEALQRTKWNRKRAARELQISYKSLLYKLKQIEGIEEQK
jgi:two-component system response regulator AtoC